MFGFAVHTRPRHDHIIWGGTLYAPREKKCTIVHQSTCGQLWVQEWIRSNTTHLISPASLQAVGAGMWPPCAAWARAWRRWRSSLCAKHNNNVRFYVPMTGEPQIPAALSKLTFILFLHYAQKTFIEKLFFILGHGVSWVSLRSYLYCVTSHCWRDAKHA